MPDVKRENPGNLSDEDRWLAHCAPALIPLLERRISRALDELVSAQRSGRTEFLPEVTKYITLREIFTEVTTKLKSYQGDR